MPPALEADVGVIHIAGGALRTTPPPGTSARTAPRRAGRGRAEDLLFLDLSLTGAPNPPSALQQHLSQVAAEAFYQTPGSVTSALREAAAAVNDRLNDANHNRDGADYQANWMAAVLRGSDFYVAQAGRGEAIHIRGDSVRRFSSKEAAQRPLGTSPSPAVRYHHLEVHPRDLILITSAAPPTWSEPVLAAVAGLEPAQAIEQLSHAREADLTGLLLRLVPEGQGVTSLPQSPSAAEKPASRKRPRRRSKAGAAISSALRPIGRWLAGGLAPLWRGLRAALVRAAAAITRLLVRLAPGLIEPPRPGEFSPALLATTAVAVPLIVLALVSVVYVRRGRGQQYQAYLAEAQSAIASAQAAAQDSEALQAWRLAEYYVDRAHDYGDGQERAAMATQVAGALDELNQVNRLEFTAAVSGGFGGDAQIDSLAATASDLYVLDTAGQRIWHAWGTGRGYEINRDFDCLTGPDSVQGMSTPIDIAIQPEPGALGAEGVVAIDADGTVLYCAPERRSSSTQLATPGSGFGRITAVNVFQDTLYILDARANAVWLYDASGGLFSGESQLYFVEEVPDLSTAVDIAKSQDELFILYEDGSLDRCLREQENGTIRVTCEQDLTFQGPQPGGGSGSFEQGAISEILYSPPPEPSLFLLDEASASVFHYSMRVVYQGRIEPTEPFPEPVTALTLGPPNDLFVASGGQVFYTPLR